MRASIWSLRQFPGSVGLGGSEVCITERQDPRFCSCLLERASPSPLSPLPLPSPGESENWESAHAEGWGLRNVLLALALGQGSVSREGLVVGLVKFCGTRQVISEVIRETHGPLQRGKRKGLLGH